MAIKVLNLDKNDANNSKGVRLDFSLKDLRYAYFEAAKKCHPDTRQHDNNKDQSNRSKSNDSGGIVFVVEQRSWSPHQPQKQQPSPQDGHKDFLLLVQAYEHLQHLLQQQEHSQKHDGHNDMFRKSKSKSSSRANYYYYESDDHDSTTRAATTTEASFRMACASQLGVPAEIVEECKGDPMFLQWLSGYTDAAQHWKTFLDLNGGLGPILSTAQPQLVAGSATTMQRRRRPPPR
ncbi:hypothetical protein ACA910_002698 [Epithemia clementina (nom. ined.)]